MLSDDDIYEIALKSIEKNNYLEGRDEFYKENFTKGFTEAFVENYKIGYVESYCKGMLPLYRKIDLVVADIIEDIALSTDHVIDIIHTYIVELVDDKVKESNNILTAVTEVAKQLGLEKEQISDIVLEKWYRKR